ncbi:MAG: FapA family protein, partial [Treponema sp.]|nr:FapA family protein [Treponema sp.]
MAAIAKGTVDIVINSEATAATLVFIPDAEGLGWDCDAVIKLAREKGVHPLPAASDIDLETFMSKAARAKAPLEKIIAESAGPEAAEPESVLWETLAVPGDMEAFKNETLAKAKGPLLFRTKTEKVKRDTIVRKPGRFPFMAAKEEVVTVWEKKETREPVLVKPDLLSARYAAANEKLGVFSAAKPGKPGNNIYGKPAPPAVLDDPSFYLGEGIRREKNDLYAVYGGFVRIGANWADIVPLAKSRFEIKSGSGAAGLFLNFYVGDPRFPLPSAADVLQAAKNLGAGEGDLVSAEELADALAAAVTKREDLPAFPLLLPREAEARVAVSDDGLKAVLVLRKGIAGAPPLETRAISQAIKDSKVQGYNAEELRAAVTAFMRGSAAALTYTLVEGAAATRGADREVRLAVNPLDAEPARVILDRLASSGAALEGFPASEAEQVCLVEKGARIAQVTKPPNGEQGKDVFGHLMPGLPGNDPDLKLFRGLHLHGSDIVAGDSGLLLMKGGGSVFWAAIAEYRDASVTVNVSGDGMEAACELVCAAGAGLPLTAELVYKALAEAGVTRGINKDGIETACKLAALKGRVNQVLARGRRPVAAGGAALSWLIPEPRAGVRMAVTKGMALVDVITLAEGRAGFTVRGEDLAPAAKADAAENPSWDTSVAAREIEISAGEDESAGLFHASADKRKRLFAVYGGE